MIISSQICVSKFQRFFTLGDGCWLPTRVVGGRRVQSMLKQKSSKSKCHFRGVIFCRVPGALPLHERKGILLPPGAFRGLGYRWPSTGVKRPFPGKLKKKSEKGFPGPLGPGVKKGSKKTIKRLFFKFFSGFWLVFDSFFDFFGGYVDPGAESPRQPLFRLFSEFSREKAFDSCRWPTISQSEGLFRKMTLVFPCFAVYATYEQVSLSRAYMGRIPGNSPVLAKYPNEKLHFENDTWTR